MDAAVFAILFHPQLSTLGSAHLGLGLPGMGNAGVSITALHPLELELGIEGSPGHRGATARIGPAIGLIDRRDADHAQGITAHAPILIGYRNWDFGREFSGHAITVNPTLTVDLWVGRHIALEGSFTAGVNIMLSDRSNGVGRVLTPDVALRAGLAF